MNGRVNLTQKLATNYVKYARTRNTGQRKLVFSHILRSHSCSRSYEDFNLINNFLKKYTLQEKFHFTCIEVSQYLQ